MNLNNPLAKIAISLGELYRQRAELRIKDRHLGELEEKRVAAITPAEGWPGKNETERKCSMNTMLAADDELTTIKQHISDASDELERFGAEIHVLEAEKEAYQWTIRDGFLAKSTFSEIADEKMEELIDDKTL